MKRLKLITCILILDLLLLSGPASSYQTSFEETSVTALPVTAGSVPIVAHTTQLTFHPNYPIHFIGDSRTVGMESALQYYGYSLDNHSFSAEIGKGYSWLTQQDHLTTLSPSILIINLGVNDLGNSTRYQSLYEAYAKTCWKDCPIYIVSVNPCCSPCTSVSNQQIEAFNTSMQQWIQKYNEENASASTETFPIHYIDTYHLLQSEGYSSSDGLHYSATTYEHIYNYILDCIQEPIGDGTGNYTVSSCGNFMSQVLRTVSSTRIKNNVSA